MKQNSERKISVEDLLRLKRAERPAAQFWERFDAEIRAKQLSAIVIRRPWWSELASVTRALRRRQSLLGAAAAAAVALAAYRFTESRPVHQAVPSSPPVSEAPGAAAAASAAASAAAPAAAPAEVASVVDRPAAPAPAPLAAEEPSHITQAPSIAAAMKPATRSAFGDGIAVSLADFREPVADSSRSPFSSDRDFEAAIAPARAQGPDPLARMDPAAERRARLLSPGLPTSAARTFASDWMRQRASTNDRMYESMDRVASDERSLVGFRF